MGDAGSVVDQPGLEVGSLVLATALSPQRLDTGHSLVEDERNPGRVNDEGHLG